MNRKEKQEIKSLPTQYKPVGAWGYFGLGIIFAIPVIGWIILIVCALSNKNVVRRSFARSYFVWLLVCLVLVGAVAVWLILSAQQAGVEPLAFIKAFWESIKTSAGL